MNWINENVVGRGLTPCHLLTSIELVRQFGPELGSTDDERLTYASQIVEKFNQYKQKQDN